MSKVFICSGLSFICVKFTGRVWNVFRCFFVWIIVRNVYIYIYSVLLVELKKTIHKMHGTYIKMKKKCVYIFFGIILCPSQNIGIFGRR